jgi:hypothetical protein
MARFFMGARRRAAFPGRRLVKKFFAEALGERLLVSNKSVLGLTHHAKPVAGTTGHAPRLALRALAWQTATYRRSSGHLHFSLPPDPADPSGS